MSVSRLIAIPAVAALAALTGLLAPAGFDLSAAHRPLASGGALAAATARAAVGTPPVDTPPPAFMAAGCSPTSTPISCNGATLAAIDAARHAEGLGPLALPPDFMSLSYVSQLVAVTNAERTSRHLPALTGPRGTFDSLAELGAAHASDPAGPAGTTWVSVLAAGFWTPLQADYQWMYNDGPGGSNAGCTPVDRSGCWAHRDNILSPWSGGIGAAARRARAPYRLVFAELIVKKS